jgi:hypothetical protein
MTWHRFLIPYTVASILLVAIPSLPLRSRWRQTLRVMLVAFAISFFIDYPGERRPLWRFDEPSLFPLLDVPLENMIFLAASVPYILTLYLGAQTLFRHRNEQL